MPPEWLYRLRLPPFFLRRTDEPDLPVDAGTGSAVPPASASLAPFPLRGTSVTSATTTSPDMSSTRGFVLGVSALSEANF